MNTKIKYLLGGVAFVLCFCVAFFLTKYAKAFIGPDAKEEVIVPDPEPMPSEEETPSAPLEIVAAEVEKTGSNYSLIVACKNVPDGVVLSYEIAELELKSTDGSFSKIPACKFGRYTLYVKDSSNGEILASKEVVGFDLVEDETVERMSSAAFQALLLNQNDNTLLGGKHPQVAKTVTLSFDGLNDGEKKPGDILAVREKIAYGIWTSAIVQMVGYDAKGKINYAKIKPVY